jgi:hypothetical protein
MKPPMPRVFEVVIDHNDVNHHGQMDRMARELKAWASQLGTTQLIREQQELRPGVFRLRFKPDPAAKRRVGADQLVLSRA